MEQKMDADESKSKSNETFRLVRDAGPTEAAPASVVAGEIRVVEFGPGVLAIEASFSSPPGSRVGLRLERIAATAADAGAPAAPELFGAFGLKVHQCKRNERGAFVIAGRPIDLRKEGSAALASMAMPHEGGKNVAGGPNDGARGDGSRGVQPSHGAGRRVHRAGVR